MPLKTESDLITSKKMKTFSQRKGLKPLSEIIQTDSMNDDLRNSLWNALDTALWSTPDFLYKGRGVPHIEPFSRALWFNYFKKPIDARPLGLHREIHTEIRNYFFSCKWFEVYDFLEFVVGYYKDNFYPSGYDLPVFFNLILERELSGYRFVSGVVVNITNAQELEMLALALNDTQFAGVSAHLQRALELYADRERPDYRNSIKESISAVESMARIITNDQKATLSDALKVMEKRGLLHQALKDGFIKLYGYTSDEDGIRHAMLCEPTLTSSDALYFLLSCTSFSNYLKGQLP